MRIVDEIVTTAPPDLVYQVAADVERWPHILAHYRWVRMHETAPAGGGIVEMSAWRPFPGFRWPTWWTSEMRLDPDRRDVHYRHIKGVTTGMNVVWQIRAVGKGTHIKLVHEWDGPAWPIIGRPAAKLVILPIFFHGIAVLTLAGVSREAERLNA
jgi:ribosome-associated toxin RatA of RatAB toxin-antitoxin module